MIIKLKLVGTNEECTINLENDKITIIDIFNYLMENNLSYDEVSKLMFIHNGKNITNDTNTIYENIDDDPLNIHIFVTDGHIKNELLKYIFNNNFDDTFDNESLEPIELDKPIIQKQNMHIELSLEDLNKKNNEIVNLFSDNDFTYLLKICLTKPDLINKVSSYLLNGNITTDIQDINNDEFKYPEIYINLVELLNKLNISKEENEIKSVIQHFEGNLNLALRYLLVN